MIAMRGVDMMLKSTLGIDPEELRKAMEQLPQIVTGFQQFFSGLDSKLNLILTRLHDVEQQLSDLKTEVESVRSIRPDGPAETRSKRRANGVHGD
jgi:archaellum component FlaC